MPLQPAYLLRDRYRIMGELGRGVGGIVYRAFDEQANTDCVIQEIELDATLTLAQFEQTAERLSSLQNPNIAKVLDHFAIEQVGYLVVEFVAGESARQWLIINGRPLAEEDVVRWAHEALGALMYLSRRVPPVSHGNLKAGNLRLTPQGQLKLVNFGLNPAMMLGTSPLSPPELASQRTKGLRDDLYALGGALYTLLTGQAITHPRLLVPVRQINPAVSEATAQAIERALGQQAEQRFNTPAEFAAALATNFESALERQRSDVVAEKRRPEASAPTGPRWPGIVAAVCMVAGFGLAGAWLWYNNSRLVVTPTRVAEATATMAQSTATLAVVNDVTATAEPTHTGPPPTNTLPPPTKVPPTATPQLTSVAPVAGEQIAFVSERLGVPQIFLMNADGTNQRPLTNQAGGACQPAWSPDGMQLLFISPCARKAVTYREAALYRINADGSEVTLLLQQEGGVFDVAWSPSGLAFVSFVSTRPQIFGADADGSNVKRLSVPSASDRQPTWSTDGQRIVFLNVSRVPGQSILYVMNRDGSYEGSSPLQVTRDLDASQPAWSPDGNLIAFVADGLLYTVEWDQLGFGAQRLTSVRPNEKPSWSPDGQALAFESLRDDPFGSDIYRITLSGEPATRLTIDPAKDYQPAWQP